MPLRSVASFTLIAADGTEVLSTTYEPGTPAWETLIDKELPAGKYTLKVSTKGNGKNTFAIRLGGVSSGISADLLTVNVHTRDWIPTVNIKTDGNQHVVRIYDGDGPKELEARLRDQNGKIYPVVVSEDLKYSDISLPAAAGTYTVELRQPSTAKQFSNSVAFRLTRQGVPTPITLAQVDQTGLLRITAELVLPTGNVPTIVKTTIGKTPLLVDNKYEQSVKPNTYSLTVQPIAGATIEANPSIVVPKNGIGEGKVYVRPQVALSLVTNKPQVCLGDTVTLTARATTVFAGALPMSLKLDASDLQVEGLTQLESELNAAHPGMLIVKGKATKAGPVTVTATLAPWGKTATVKLNVLADATSLELTRQPIADAVVGDEIVVGLTLSNTANAPTTYVLTDQASAGLEPLSSTQFTGTLAAGETRTLSYRARVTEAGEFPLKASLKTPSCAVTQAVAGKVVVATPVPPQRPVLSISHVSTVNLPFEAPQQVEAISSGPKPSRRCNLCGGQ